MTDFASFLQDHASCEKKASGMALSISAHYPDKPDIVSAMTDLAVEELSHYREVIQILTSRNLPPAADIKDPYVNALNKCIRKSPDTFLMDRLLVAAIVEKRGHERFSIVMEHLKQGSEKKHYQLFLELAQIYSAKPTLESRLKELLELEKNIVLTLPLRAALH